MHLESNRPHISPFHSLHRWVTACLCALVLCLTACTYSRPQASDSWIETDASTPDSATFLSTHHYWKKDVFSVIEPFTLSEHPPTELSRLRKAPHDAGIKIEKGNTVFVWELHQADTDGEGTKKVWVKVARDRNCCGWISERELLSHTTPNHPISKFIHRFSDSSLLWYGGIILSACLILMIRKARKRQLHIVHFNDVRSFYPTLLCLTTSAAATLYGTLQRFAPDTWVEYYFHPTLNPLTPGLPALLVLFILSIWGMLIVGIATIEDLRHIPQRFGLLSYLAGLALTCVLLHLLFSLTVHIYVGYPLLALYAGFAFHRHHRLATPHHRCAACGAPLEALGICPQCGQRNV